MKSICIVVIGRNDIAHLNRSLVTAAKQCESIGEHCRVLYADDASDDGSADFAEAIAVKHPSISIYKSPIQRNIGGIRNAAVAYLSSLGDKSPDYIWLHDSDDFITDNALSRVLDALEKNNYPDGLSVPIYTMRNPKAQIPDCSVIMKSIEDAPMGPVGEWSIVFRRPLYVPNPENQACEDAPWHYEQFDRFSTWGKVEGPEPCYIWDCTNPNAITRTVEYCSNHSFTILAAACENVLINANKNDRWVSDNLRNIANMYDVRNRITKPNVRAAWLARFKTEVLNFSSGFHVH